MRSRRNLEIDDNRDSPRMRMPRASFCGTLTAISRHSAFGLRLERLLSPNTGKLQRRLTCSTHPGAKTATAPAEGNNAWVN